MNRNRLLLPALLLLALPACNPLEPVGCKITYSRHFVGEYLDVPEISLRDHSDRNEKNDPYVFHIDFNYDQRASYLAPEVSAGIESWTEEQRQRNDTRFMELARHYGDLNYHFGWMFTHDHLCSAEPFRTIHLVCRNHALDEAHPAGQPLDDIVKAELLSYRDYIRGGYEPFFVEGKDGTHWEQDFNVIEKYLADLTMDDLQLFDINRSGVFLYIDRSYLAAPGDYEFVVTMTSESGKTFEAEYTLSLGLTEAE